jgi:hypothetical protein
VTISSSVRKAGPFPGNGATTVFAFAFKVFTTADVLVVLATTATGVEVTQVISTNYTVSLNADQNASPGGTVTMLAAPASGTTLTLTSQVAQTQSVDLQNAGGFYPSVINTALDKIVILIQQLAEKLGRAVVLPISSTASAQLPAPVAGAYLVWDGTATTLTTASGTATSTVSSAMQPVVAGATLAAARTAMGVAESGANSTITSLTGLTAGGLPDNSVLTADIANAQVTPAKLSQPLTRGTSVATTSGTSIGFTGIPNWVKRITLLLNQVSTNGTSPLIVRLGVSGVPVTINYRTAANLNSNVATSTSGFLLEFSRTGVGNETDGMLVLTAQGSAGLAWQGMGATGRSTDGAVPIASGSSYLAGTLDSIFLTTVGGADTFDNGSVNILYE